MNYCAMMKYILHYWLNFNVRIFISIGHIVYNEYDVAILFNFISIQECDFYGCFILILVDISVIHVYRK